jgi:hypothetical protein
MQDRARQEKGVETESLSMRQYVSPTIRRLMLQSSGTKPKTMTAGKRGQYNRQPDVVGALPFLCSC